MAKLIRFVSIFFILAPLTAMFSEPFFEAVFDRLGWDTESWAAPFVQFAIDANIFLINPNVLTTSYVVGAFGAGVWLHWIAARLDSRRPSKSERFLDLSSSIHNMRDDLFEGAKDGNGEVDFKSRNHQIVLQLRALYAELRPLGLRPPNYDADTNIVFNVGHYSYLQTLEPFAERGLISEAKRQEKIAKAEFKSANRKLQSPSETG